MRTNIDRGLVDFGLLGQAYECVLWKTESRQTWRGPDVNTGTVPVAPVKPVGGSFKTHENYNFIYH